MQKLDKLFLIQRIAVFWMMLFSLPESLAVQLLMLAVQLLITDKIFIMQYIHNTH